MNRQFSKCQKEASLFFSLICEFLILILIKIVMDYAYVSFVYPLFEYAGFVYDFVLHKYMIGWILYLAGYSLLILKKGLSIYEIFLLIYLILVLPVIVFFSFANREISDLLTILIPFFLVVFLTSKNFCIRVPGVKGGKNIVIIISMLFSLLVGFNLYFSTGGEAVFSYSDEYEYRENFDKLGARGVFGYLNNWVAYVFIVLLLGWSLSAKKWLVFYGAILFTVILFAYSGHKGVLQGAFVVVFFHFVYKFRNTRLLILSGFLLLIGVSIVAANYYSQLYVGSLILRRLLLVPAHLHFVYLEFFSNHDFVYWSNGVLSAFIEYPYKTRTVEQVGLYLGKEGLAANCGFLSTGFMHAGYFGILVYVIISVIVFNVIEILSKGLDKFIVASIVFIPVTVLFLSADLLTSFFTHGLFVSLFVLWLYGFSGRYITQK